MSVPIDEVLRTLRLFTQGATVRQLAEHMSMKQFSLGSRLSKQYVQGRGTVEREAREIRTATGRHEEFVYSAKERA